MRMCRPAEIIPLRDCVRPDLRMEWSLCRAPGNFCLAEATTSMPTIRQPFMINKMSPPRYDIGRE